MTTYRTRRAEAGPRITAEAVAAFRAGDWIGLHRALRLRPWEASPLDAATDTPIRGGQPYVDSWAQARELRLALEAA